MQSRSLVNRALQVLLVVSRSRHCWLSIVAQMNVELPPCLDHAVLMQDSKQPLRVASKLQCWTQSAAKGA